LRGGKAVVNYKQGKRIADANRRHMYNKHTKDSEKKVLLVRLKVDSPVPKPLENKSGKAVILRTGIHIFSKCEFCDLTFITNTNLVNKNYFFFTPGDVCGTVCAVSTVRLVSLYFPFGCCIITSFIRRNI
jgi:hypothetical protein